MGLRRALLLATVVLAGCMPDDAEREAELASEGGAAGDTAVADSADSAAAADSAAPGAAPLLRDPTPLTLAITSSPTLHGTADVFAECRVLPGADGAAQYEVATTNGDFEGGGAALGLIVGAFTGPGVYERDVTVTIVLGREGDGADLRAGRTGCIVRVESLQGGSFSCEAPPAPAATGVSPQADTASIAEVDAALELVGTGSWRCR